MMMEVAIVMVVIITEKNNPAAPVDEHLNTCSLHFLSVKNWSILLKKLKQACGSW